MRTRHLTAVRIVITLNGYKTYKLLHSNLYNPYNSDHLWCDDLKHIGRCQAISFLTVVFSYYQKYNFFFYFLRLFLSFKRKEGVFLAFRPVDKVKHSYDPQESWSFTAVFSANEKIFEIICHRKLDRKWVEKS